MVGLNPSFLPKLNMPDPELGGLPAELLILEGDPDEDVGGGSSGVFCLKGKRNRVGLMGGWGCWAMAEEDLNMTR